MARQTVVLGAGMVGVSIACSCRNVAIKSRWSIVANLAEKPRLVTRASFSERRFGPIRFLAI